MPFYVRKPIENPPFEARQVSDTEADEIARWCGGVHTRRAGGAWGVYVNDATGTEQEAGYGDWVVLFNVGGRFCTFKAEEFDFLFELDMPAEVRAALADQTEETV